MEHLQLTGGKGKSERRELDFYPTPANVTEALMIFLTGRELVDHNMNVWEPACGNGSMSEVLKKYFNNVYSSDIRTTGYGDGNVDFLKEQKDGFDVIITNPPFNLSVEFIQKSTSEAKIVCMLLKSQYWHAKNRLKLFYENRPTFVLPLTWRPDFLEHEKRNGDPKGKPTMEVAWTVWIQGQNDTYYTPLIKPL